MNSVLPARRGIAVAQACAVPGDVAANLDQHVRLSRLGLVLGANVVVFPERSLTGYELEQADALAFQRIDDRLAPLLASWRGNPSQCYGIVLRGLLGLEIRRWRERPINK